MNRPLGFALAAALSIFAARAHALPVIPGMGGFGIETPAGRGGTVYRVTNLNATGAGSLKACIDATGPRVCVFEISGTITLTSDLAIRNDKITIAGQTAPSPGILLRGAAIRIQASDVLIQHLRIRVGDDKTGPTPENRDALKIEGTTAKPVRNVVVDHCSFSWAIDETVSVWGAYDNIILSNNIYSEALNQSLHPNGAHGFGVILGPSAGSSVTMFGNLFAHIVERNPLSRSSELVFVNNIVYDRSTMDVDIQGENNSIVKGTLLHNLFIRGPSYSRDTTPIRIHTGGSLAVGKGSTFYQAGNRHYGYARELLSVTAGMLPDLITTTGYPVWTSGMPMVNSANDAVYHRVLANVGARPVDRDSVDKRIIKQVQNRTGAIINCVAANGTTRCSRNAGSFPYIKTNRRALTLPANPNSVASNGYTNLENWLHQLDKSLAGEVQANSPGAPGSLVVR